MRQQADSGLCLVITNDFAAVITTQSDVKQGSAFSISIMHALYLPSSHDVGSESCGSGCGEHHGFATDSCISQLHSYFLARALKSTMMSKSLFISTNDPGTYLRRYVGTFPGHIQATGACS